MIGTIYKLTSPSGKHYIGQTMDARRRRRTFSHGVAYYSGARMDNAVKKYGSNNFKYEILCQLYNINREKLRCQLDELEIAYIKIYDSYKSGYNMTEGGSGAKGCFHTEKSKTKLRKIALGRISPFKGLHHTEENKQAARERGKLLIGANNPFYGKSHTDKVKKAISEANSKPVIQMDLNGNFLKEFSSAKEAGDYLGNPRANSEIIKVCKGYISPKGKRYLTSLGYRWKYKQSSTTIP
jgi:group I intron endonuclease